MTIERVLDFPMFRQNTAAFIHALPAGSFTRQGVHHGRDVTAWHSPASSARPTAPRLHR